MASLPDMLLPVGEPAVPLPLEFWESRPVVALLFMEPALLLPLFMLPALVPVPLFTEPALLRVPLFTEPALVPEPLFTDPALLPVPLFIDPVPAVPLLIAPGLVAGVPVLVVEFWLLEPDVPPFEPVAGLD